MNKNNELTEFAKDVLSSTPPSVSPLQRKIFGEDLSDFTLRLANAVKRGEDLKIAGYEKTYFGADKIAAWIFLTISAGFSQISVSVL